MKTTTENNTAAGNISQVGRSGEYSNKELMEFRERAMQRLAELRKKFEEQQSLARVNNSLKKSMHRNNG